MRFLVMLSGGMAAWIRVSSLNASDVGQGIAVDVKELLTVVYIHQRPGDRSWWTDDPWTSHRA
jgi:hypothetical protein